MKKPYIINKMYLLILFLSFR